MDRIRASRRATRPHTLARDVGLMLLLSCTVVGSSLAATTGKLQGRIVATDNGEPIGFADILLLPADTTLHRVGGLTNADGTFLLEAAPGRYTLQIRALSYATKRIEGIELKVGELLPFTTASGRPEPFEGVAPVLARRLAEVIAQLRTTGLSVILSESSMTHAHSLLDRVFTIDRGSVRVRLISVGPPGHLALEHVSVLHDVPRLTSVAPHC